MNNVTDTFSFVNSVRGRTIVLAGAASAGKRAVLALLEQGFKKEDMLFYDINPDKWGERILGIEVLSTDAFAQLPSDIPVLITSSMYPRVQKEMAELGKTNAHYLRMLIYTERLFLKYDDRFLKILDEVRETCNMDSDEKFTLYSSMKAVTHVPGDVAEVGVYKGGSAKIICEEKGNKEIHLFDTFAGLPGGVIQKSDLVKGGWLDDTTAESVKEYLKEYGGVHVYQGLFPDTAGPVADKKFCLVHLDTDIYQGTIEGLRFFWPRMVTGGRIICHDYNNVDCPGVKRAFQEFFADSPERIIDIADTQGMVVKDIDKSVVG